MPMFKGRNTVVIVGMGMALLAGLVIAVLIVSRDRGPRAAPPASQGGLVVETGRDDDIKLDVRHPLRCFVNGQLVGELTLSDCAKRNGVASGALDVGLDASGALAAANGASGQITPLPPGAQNTVAAGSDDAAAPESAVLAASTRDAGCWRYGQGEWTRLPDDMPLAACMSALYEGICAVTGPPAYGRWGDRTLRLVAGRVEISADNRDFRVLADRNPGCGPPG